MTSKKKPKGAQVDEIIEETFPASDPPPFIASDVIGAPSGRSSQTKPRKSAPPTQKPDKRHKDK